MDKLEVLELEMQLIVQVGTRFYNELQKAKAKGIDINFYNEASSLIIATSGDANSGVIDSVRDAQKDNRLMSEFLSKWENSPLISDYPDVMKGVRATKSAHDGFLETVKELSNKEKVNIEKYGKLKVYGSYEAGYASGEKLAKASKGIVNGIRSWFK